jgi:Lar family restriction alleviation protein
MRDDLKPCPFCGERDLIPTSNGFENFYIFCNQCGAEGPSGTTEKTAADVWNERKEKPNA